ncbi:MAG: hypothetical protein PHE77_02415 [Candidatus Pacebacteria bacterium]|nr:hypothetical protein [Candidatus Paceibacterota bacterium]
MNKKQIFAIAASIIITIFSVVIITQATTIGNDVSIGGTLTVSSTSTLATTTTTYLTSLGIGVTDLVDFNATDFNTKIGYQAGKNIVSGAQYNTFFGYEAGLSSSTASTNAADKNVGIGYRVLYSNTTGRYNVAIGNHGPLSANSPLEFNTTGEGNTVIGAGSLQANTTGVSNTAVGTLSLSYNTTGAENTVYGVNALWGNTTGSYNTIVGKDAGDSTTGVFNNNTLVGYRVGYNQTTAYSSNTAIGYKAGYNLVGDSNVMLGNYAGAYETGSNAFYIDNQNRTNTAGDQAGALLYGTFSATPASQTLRVNATLSTLGNLGVGTSTPAYNLEVSSSASTTVMIGSGALTGCLGIGDTDQDGITWCTALNGTLTCTSTKPQQCK